VAVALVGSWARGAGRAGSDVDLVVLAREPGRLLSESSWFGVFGSGATLVRSGDFGVIQERRLRRPDGLEVEVGIGGLGWATAEPTDVGSLRVAREGLRVLHDPHRLLHALAMVAKNRAYPIWGRRTVCLAEGSATETGSADSLADPFVSHLPLRRGGRRERGGKWVFGSGLSEPAGPGALRSGCVGGVEQRASGQGQAPAAQALVERVLQGLELTNPGRDQLSPRPRQTAPVLLIRRAVSRQLGEEVLELLQGQPYPLPGGDEGQAAQDVAGVAALVARRAGCAHQTEPFVVPQRRRAETGAVGDFAHGQPLIVRSHDVIIGDEPS